MNGPRWEELAEDRRKTILAQSKTIQDLRAQLDRLQRKIVDLEEQVEQVVSADK